MFHIWVFLICLHSTLHDISWHCLWFVSGVAQWWTEKFFNPPSSLVLHIAIATLLQLCVSYPRLSFIMCVDTSTINALRLYFWNSCNYVCELRPPSSLMLLIASNAVCELRPPSSQVRLYTCFIMCVDTSSINAWRLYFWHSCNYVCELRPAWWELFMRVGSGTRLRMTTYRDWQDWRDQSWSIMINRDKWSGSGSIVINQDRDRDWMGPHMSSNT
jgi:hypothetical protein